MTGIHPLPLLATGPCLRKHLAPDEHPFASCAGSRRRGRGGRAEPSTGRHNPERCFAPPAPARPTASPRGGAHAQCARGAEWAPPCLPLPGSGEWRLSGACGGRRCWSPALHPPAEVNGGEARPCVPDARSLSFLPFLPFLLYGRPSSVVVGLQS